MRGLVLAAAVSLLATACDFSEMTEPAASTTCGAIGARCQLPDGPLGVCLQRPCAATESPPCFACTPQH